MGRRVNPDPAAHPPAWKKSDQQRGSGRSPCRFERGGPLGESKFFVSGGLAIGGLGDGSDFMWNANVNLGYRWTETFSTTIWYRYLDVDYEKTNFLYDVAQDGP